MTKKNQDLTTLMAENARLQAMLAQKQTLIEALQEQLHPTHPLPEGLPILTEIGNLEQFLFLVQEVFSAVLLTDAQGHVIWTNRGFSKLCGYELHEMAGKHAKFVLRKNLQDAATDAYIEKCLAQNLPFQYEVQNPNPACEENWVRVKVQPVFGKYGEVILYAGLIEDITESKQAQLRIIESEQRFRALIENAPGVLYEWHENFDGTCEFTYASPKLQELFGIPPTIESSSLIGDFIHPEDRSRWRQSVMEANRRRIPWHFEGRVVVPGQPLRWWRGDSIIVGEDEQGLLYQGIIQDITSSKLAQEAVRESEHRWRAAMEGVGNDTWEYNCQTQELFLSQKYRDLLGYHGQPVQVHVGAAPWYTNVHPDDQAAARQAITAYLSGELPLYSTTYRISCPDGQDKWILSRAMVTKRDERANPLLVTGTHTDVTEITRAQLALEASTLRLASTIANLPSAVLLEDENRKVIMVNKAYCRLFELPYSPKQLIGVDRMLLAEQIKSHFSNEESFVQNIVDITNRQAIQGEILTLKDGRTLERDSTPIYAKNNYIGYLWQYEDITQRKTDEDALKRREEKYRNILENLNLGLLEVDANRQVMFVNDSYCEITGYTRAELLHTDLDHLMAHEAGRQLIREKSKLRIQGISDTYELPLKTKRGEVKWLLVSGAPLYDDEKQFVGSIGVHLDITHQKQLEVKLREAKRYAEESARAKEMFLTNMSHEIRTPMNAILGMSQLLAKTPLSSPQDNYLNAISSSAESLLVIINDILDLSKIDAGKMTIEHIGFDLRKVCEQVEKTLQYKAEDKGLSLIVQISPEIPAVLLGDPHRLTQVLLNLAGNSIKFTEKGHVWISCELVSTFEHRVLVEFSVCDTGIGIDPKYLKNIFQNFSQEDSSVSRKFGGSGLGLSISRSLVNLMDGEMQIESEKHQGTVSTFSLLLPIGSAADLPHKDLPGNPMANRADLRGKRILLVEDNEYNRMLAKSLLELAHMEVTEAENGAVAVELARNQEFDLILMDVQMPVMNGLEATVRLRKELALQVPIIALTANAIRGDNQKCLDVGMNDYLSKPFYEVELLKIVQEWLQVTPQPAPKTSRSPEPGPEPESSLYDISLLKEAAQNNSDFVAFMLRTFLKSSEDVLNSMHKGMLTADIAMLREAAHKIKPSLAHLKARQVLALVEQLESWEDPFNQQALEPLLEITEKSLRQVMVQIAQDLEAHELT